MVKLSDEFSSGSLKAEDLQGRDITLTIRGAELKTFKDDGAGADKKLAVQFLKTDKELICNKTNREVISTLYGDDTDHWIGQRITLYPTRVAFQGKMTNAIRVREWIPGANPAPAPAPQAAAHPQAGYQAPYPPPSQAPYQPQPPQSAAVPSAVAGTPLADDDDIPF
jgi:hypothetical protein